MFKRVSHTSIYVLDLDQALDFYVGKLGMVVHTDADLGEMRFLTVTVPGGDLEVGLMLPGPPLHDEATASEARELIAKGAAGGGLIFETSSPTRRPDAVSLRLVADSAYKCRLARGRPARPAGPGP